MCIIDGEFYLNSDGRIYYGGRLYNAVECEFMAGSKLVFKAIDEKLDKPKAKTVKIADAFIPIESESDMNFIPALQAQEPHKTQPVIEQAPIEEIDLFKQINQLTGNNLPLTIAIVLAVLFYKSYKERKQDEHDHSVACDLERKDLARRLDIMTSRIDDAEKKGISIQVMDDDLKDRIEKLEKRLH